VNNPPEFDSTLMVYAYCACDQEEEKKKGTSLFERRGECFVHLIDSQINDPLQKQKRRKKKEGQRTKEKHKDLEL